jgi:hypothetical protein
VFVKYKKIYQFYEMSPRYLLKGYKNCPGLYVMKTRHSVEHDHHIDFDEASAEWRRNKKALSNGMFSYVCGINTKSGKPCQRVESHRRFHKNDTENSDK